MNWDQIEGKWDQWKGKAREKWGQLTDSDWEQIGGKKDRLVGKLQERYGWSKEQAERECETWAGDRQQPAGTTTTGGMHDTDDVSQGGMDKKKKVS